MRQIPEFDDLNKSLSQEELEKMIAETIWMADRQRTWCEYFCSIFEDIFTKS